MNTEKARRADLILKMLQSCEKPTSPTEITSALKATPAELNATIRACSDWLTFREDGTYQLNAAGVAELARRQNIEREVSEPEQKTNGKKEKTPQTSFIETDTHFFEEIWDAKNDARFVAYEKASGTYELVASAEKNGVVYEPIEGEELPTGAVLLPTEPQEYGTTEQLLLEIRQFVHDYLDVLPEMEIFAANYVLLSWVYDRLNTIPYLRALGDTGCGKSRFLEVIGGIAYKASKVSGCITPAPVYRLLRKWGGTLVMDEADFGNTDEKAELIKILNCGFTRGTPVVRCMKDAPDDLQFLPTFCPKVFSTRYTFKDVALESRCLTEKMRETERKDIPTELPAAFFERRRALQNKLLLWRLRNRQLIDPEAIQKLDLGDIEPRLKQAAGSFAVLFGNQPTLLARFREFLAGYQRELIEERGATYEGRIMFEFFALYDNPDMEPGEISISDIHAALNDEKITSAAIGRYLKTLGIKTKQRKIAGKVLRVLVFEDALISRLRRRYIPTGPQKEPDKVAVTEEKLEGNGCEAVPTIPVTSVTTVTGGTGNEGNEGNSSNGHASEDKDYA